MSSSVIDLAPPGPRSERAGVRAMAPMILAYLPFALMVGASVAARANPLAAWLATWTIYGGGAHLAVLDVLAQGSGWLAAAAVGLLVNARLTAYATAMAPQWRSAPFRQRAAAGLMLTDALVAAASVGLGLLLAFRGRSVLLAVAIGGSAYVVLSAAVVALS